MRSAAVFGAVLVTLAVASSVRVSAEGLNGSIAGDSLLFPTEVFVITREDLIDYNIHTLDDILELLPGVVSWRAGPPGSRSGFSIDGRSSYGVTLLVNGEPLYDPYCF
ncbi:MAG: Plug domain-containing protein, partial [Candidatus Krumholzibacteria bacterium]|nr:Plug domain-containing protein [Candidatus Krumholzibacteria bacterium]